MLNQSLRNQKDVKVGHLKLANQQIEI